MGVLCTIGSSTTIGLLLMDADTLEEDRLTIKQNLLTTRLNHTETDAVADGRVVECDLHLITLGVLWAPELGLGFHVDRSSTIGSSLDGLLDLQFRNAQCHRMISLRLV